MTFRTFKARATPIGRRLLLAGIFATPAIPRALGGITPAVPAGVVPEGPLPDVSGAVAPPAVPAPAPAPAPPLIAAAPHAAPARAPGLAAQAAPALPAWRRHAIAPPVMDGRPAITVVIDDMGWMHPHTEQAVALPGPLTLAWFPFSPRLDTQVPAAMAFGHETMLHMPMQSYSNSLAQTGPDPLRIDLPAAVNLARLQAAIAAVPSSVGLNNHMGSVATRNVALMQIVADQARAHGYLFLDSITVAHSVALPCAEAAGVPSAGRDIFIDYRMKAEVIRGQLALIEATARRTGHVIAIGHPRPLTLEALAAWLPTLRAKGFALWPMSATVAWRNRLPPIAARTV